MSLFPSICSMCAYKLRLTKDLYLFMYRKEASTPPLLGGVGGLFFKTPKDILDILTFIKINVKIPTIGEYFERPECGPKVTKQLGILHILLGIWYPKLCASIPRPGGPRKRSGSTNLIGFAFTVSRSPIPGTNVIGLS